MNERKPAAPVSDAELLELALQARERAYCPYSHYSVGAALLTADGRVFLGCNIENAAYSPGLCAERTAMAKAVFEGCYDFAALAVAGGAEGEIPADLAWPCGVCRQWLAEFCPPDFPVLVGRSSTDYQKLTLKELLPHSFGPGSLKVTEDASR